MPKTVLVPLDGSTESMRAIPVATALAGRFDADLRLIAAQLPGGMTRTDWLDDAVAEAHVKGAKGEAVWSLSVADAVGALADETNEPIVCMATHARTRLGHALFGSVAEDVVRALTIPAVLVGPKCRESWSPGGPLLVCLDGSDASDAIVPIAHEWAVALSAKVVLVHVFHPLDVESATKPEAVIGAAVERLAADVEVETRVLRGEYPVGTIVGLVDELSPVVVALATHGRTGLARVSLGSVATEVVRKSASPALVVRPGSLSEREGT